jgi:hypothetical protein
MNGGCVPELERVLADWRARMRPTARTTPRTGSRGRHEEALVRALLNASSASDDVGAPEQEACMRAIVLSAAAYGEDHPTARLDPASLLGQISALRAAAWQQFSTHEEFPERASRRILALDRTLSLVVRASMRGAARSDLEATGQWPRALDAVMDDVREKP